MKKLARGKACKSSAEIKAKRALLQDEISLLQSIVEEVASRARRYHDLRRNLVAGHRESLLSDSSTSRPGAFEKQQCALIEEAQRLRGALCDLGNFQQPADTLRLMTAILHASPEPETEAGEWRPTDPFRIAAQIMFVWQELSRLCDLDDLPWTALPADACDIVAAATEQTVPSEEAISFILAAGTTCVSLLKEFSDYRGING